MQKEFAIGTNGYTRSWNKVKNELDKCILVCSNCHREIHANILQCPNEIIKDNESVNILLDKFKSENKVDKPEKLDISAKQLKNYVIPSKDELIDLFKKYNTFENIGRLYGITGNAIKKQCKK